MQQDYPLEPFFRRILTPLEHFLSRTISGSLVLISATFFALAVASIFGSEILHRFWSVPFILQIEGLFQLRLSLHHVINDGLMALFFLLVGLELKREILVGELSSLKDAALPILAALGGMIGPACIYAWLNQGHDSLSGWGIPTATDIAFAIGILLLLGNRIPRNLIIFLTALAIADDLGAVLVIALFYTSKLNMVALFAASILFALLVFFNRAGVRHIIPYGFIGLFLWYALLLSGIHATIAGILLAVVLPAKPIYRADQFHSEIESLNQAFLEEKQNTGTPDDALSNQRLAAIASAMEHATKIAQSPLQRVEHLLNPWVTFFIIPIFALSNAGIDLSNIAWSEAFLSPVTLGVFLGLVFGKFIGISTMSFIAVMFNWGRLPDGVSWMQLLGAAWLGGIGFTMSLFINQLAFIQAIHIEEAKLGILMASVVSATVGLFWLRFFSGKNYTH
jgi:Na+:H+ antiporter, NhaA family